MESGDQSTAGRKRRPKIDLHAAFAAAPDTREKGGVVYRKDRIGFMARDGSFPMDQLRRDEAVIAPGIIYRREAANV